MSGLKFLGKDPAGNAKGVNVDTNGDILQQISGSKIAVPVDLQYCQLTDAEAIPTRTKNITSEYSWLYGGAEPTPTEEFAWGVAFNASTGEIAVYGWSGTEWVEVV